ncbi:MAG: glycosyltransferase family 9 protein [Planctomycetota bacterium]
MREADRILIIRPSALGDVCRSVPVLVSLKKRFPAARIDWMVQDAFIPAIEHHPDLHRAIPFPRSKLAKDLLRFKPGSLLAFIGELRRGRYDLVIDAQGLFRSGFFSVSTGARKRIGDRSGREAGWLFATRTVRTDPRSHTVDRMLELVRAAGAEPVRDLRLYTNNRQRVEAEAQLGPRFARPIVIAPTSRWAAKRWPASRFVELTRALLARTPHPIVIVGGPGEREQCEPLLELARHEPRVLDLVGETSVGGLLAVIERARLVIANDSAALHMAVGFDRPIVAIFGPTEIDEVGPYSRAADVIQRADPGCMNHKRDENARVMRAIPSREVVVTCLERLHSGS